MKTRDIDKGAALALTLIFLALVAVVVVAYLAATRTERATSSVDANRLRAQMMAESGLTSAVSVLKSNTRYGNYITAMPAPSPSPSSIYTEVYRPYDPSSGASYAAKSDDYLRTDNAAGELLVSRAITPTGTPPGADPRPSPDAVGSSANPFALPSPNPALSEETFPNPAAAPTGNSYNFNQVARIGTNNNARLVQPSPSPVPLPALGQWVNVRDSQGILIGRYAFFVEDESMKVNLNVAGNATSSRSNDLSASVTPSNQIQETDPGAILPLGSPAPDRLTANSILAGLGASDSRLLTRSTVGLLNAWKDAFPDYAHLITAVSRDDNTTARGWQRLDLNALAAGLSTPAAKMPIATRVANWIRDAWTGPSIGSLSAPQVFNDDRLRQQLAANIVDYIAPAGAPTDLSDVAPSSGATPVPVIGIEKIPYIHAMEVVFQASNTAPAPGNSVGPHTTTIKMKFQCRFLNMFESNLNLTDQIGSIVVKGVPIITKNGATLFDVSGQTFTIKATDLKPVNSPTDYNVPAGVDGTASSGARSFQTDWLVSQTLTYTVPARSDERQRLTDGTLDVQVLGKSNERLDIIKVPLKISKTSTTGLAGYYYNGSQSTGDFVEDAIPANGATQVASISLTNHLAGTTNTGPFGDPRYRPALLTDRWDNDSRTDATCTSLSDCPWLSGKTVKKNRLIEYVDTAEVSCRSYSVDWYDNAGNRPLSFIRNGQLLNIGELGNIATGEYPWRSLYLQHPERPVNTSDTPWITEVPLRRSHSVDYVLLDLFRAGGTITRSGELNINTQIQYLPPSGTVTTTPLESLFVGVPIGQPSAAATPQALTQATPGAAPSPADRLSTGVNLLVSTTTTPASSGTGTNPLNYRVASVSNKRSSIASEDPTPDNNPARPYFQIGELAPTLSRLMSASQASDTTSSSNTSQVVYSALRDTPDQKTSVKNYHRDFEVEQAFREVSNSITTRGNVFRVLYVGQTLKDYNSTHAVDNKAKILSEYLGEAYVERDAVWSAPDSANPDIIKTTDSTYKVIGNRVISE